MSMPLLLRFNAYLYLFPHKIILRMKCCVWTCNVPARIVCTDQEVRWQKKKSVEKSNPECRRSLTDRSELQKFVLHLLQGAMIGIGAVLPGISGGVLSVVFGIYEPIMAFLSNPREALSQYGRLLFPVLLGAAGGFLLSARAIGFSWHAMKFCRCACLSADRRNAAVDVSGGRRKRKEQMGYSVFLFSFILIFVYAKGL